MSSGQTQQKGGKGGEISAPRAEVVEMSHTRSHFHHCRRFHGSDRRQVSTVQRPCRSCMRPRRWAIHVSRLPMAFRMAYVACACTTSPAIESMIVTGVGHRPFLRDSHNTTAPEPARRARSPSSRNANTCERAWPAAGMSIAREGATSADGAFESAVGAEACRTSEVREESTSTVRDGTVASVSGTDGG